MRKRHGQSTVEIAVLMAVVIGALLVMQLYMKRGISGKLRESTDRVGEQYTPYSATYDMTTKLAGARDETTTSEGQINSKITTDEHQQRTGIENTVSKAMGTADSRLWDKD